MVHSSGISKKKGSRRRSPSTTSMEDAATADNIFELDDQFVNDYRVKVVPFGFNGLGELVYMRTYSRIMEDGENESWTDTIRRVVEGCYTMQKTHIEKHALGWDEEQGRRSAEEMFDKMWNMKFLPPGRGLWAMGTDIINKRGLAASLNNCCFVSTEDLNKDPTQPFTFLMDAAMLGVGVGFDTKGEGKVMIVEPGSPKVPYQISDTREAWVESLKALLASYFYGSNEVDMDYSHIRKAGLPLKVFGGISSGPQPLVDLHEKIRETLDRNVGKPITITTIVDIMNLIGKCVVAGNVRRTALISFGDAHSEEFMDLKNYEVNPHRASFGWTSNNSIFAELGMDYSKCAERIKYNGEPGFCWLENMQKYSRMNGTIDNKDKRVKGGNPCLEQSLESRELCNLVECFPSKHENLDDFKRTLKFAYLYAKTVTLGLTHWPETNRVMLRNRRIGCSISGVAQFLSTRSLEVLKEWLSRGYDTIQDWDTIYSEWLAIPKSIKTTSIKPSGTVSLLAGATPGMHWPESRFYIRRMRLGKTSALVEPLRCAGYPMEDAFGSENDTLVVEIPVDVGEGIRTVNDVSMWEQLSMAAFLQEHWADNQVSSTITFKPETEGDQIKHALDYFQYKLKGISLLPKTEFGSYPQMPYEEITREEYERRFSVLKSLNFFDVAEGGDKEDGIGEMFCDGDICKRIGEFKSKGGKAKS